MVIINVLGFSIFYRYNASFPTPIQVLTGLVDVWNDGLIMHLFNSLSLCFQAILFHYYIYGICLTTISFTKSLGTFLSKLRYLPTGIAFM
jgi:NitT/TauT family transport system permease protein